MQLLTAENRRLANEIQHTGRGWRPGGGGNENVGVTAASRTPSRAMLASGGSQIDSNDSDEVASSPLASYGRDLKTQSMDDIDRTTFDDLDPDEADEMAQVRAAMLDRVELNDTFPPQGDACDVSEEVESDEHRRSEVGSSTPRARRDSDRTSTSSASARRFRYANNLALDLSVFQV